MSAVIVEEDWPDEVAGSGTAAEAFRMRFLATGCRRRLRVCSAGTCQPKKRRVISSRRPVLLAAEPCARSVRRTFVLSVLMRWRKRSSRAEAVRPDHSHLLERS